MEDTGGVRDRDRQQEQRPDRVGADQQRLAAKTIDPGTREQPDEKDRQAAGHDQQRHLGRTRAEDEQRDQRDRRAGHHRAQLGHGLPGPQLQKIAVAPERSRDPGVVAGHDRSLGRRIAFRETPSDPSVHEARRSHRPGRGAGK